MRLSDEEEEDEDPVLRGKRLWKQWQQSRMQQNDDDGGDGDDGQGGCSVADSLLQALSKNKKLKRYKPLTASLGSEESLGDGSLRSISSAAGAGAAPDAAAAAPLVSAHIQQLSRTRCCLTHVTCSCCRSALPSACRSRVIFHAALPPLSKCPLWRKCA